MNRFSYFPGCSLHGTGREYDESIRAVFRVLDIQLDEIEDWACCGATPGHAIAPDFGEALGYWNLAHAAKTGNQPILTGCAACFSRLRAVRNELLDHPARVADAQAIAGMPVKPELEVLHLLQVLMAPENQQKLKAAVKRPLNNLPVACYYGCLLTRPSGRGAVDDAEDPHIFEDLVRLVGAQPVDFPLRLDCCGSSMALARADAVHELCGKLLSMALGRGAKVLVVACPLCHSNLDFQQPQAAEAAGLKVRLPVLYLSQLLGLALGLSEKELGLHRHFVPVPVAELLGAPATA